MFSLSPSISLSPSYKMQWHMKNKACCNCVNAKLEEKNTTSKRTTQIHLWQMQSKLDEKNILHLSTHTSHTQHPGVCHRKTRCNIQWFVLLLPHSLKLFSKSFANFYSRRACEDVDITAYHSQRGGRSPLCELLILCVSSNRIIIMCMEPNAVYTDKMALNEG